MRNEREARRWRRPGRGIVGLAALTILLFALPVALPAQQQTPEQRLRAQQNELQRLRRERQQLEQRMRTLQGTISNLSEEVSNIERQVDATERVVRSLQNQLVAITNEVATATANYVRAEDELAAKRAILQRRLSDIYKRGPLYSTEVLLAAESFGDLIARYKYLHLLAQRDRALVGRVETLRDQVRRQRSLLVRLQSDIAINRTEKAEEERRLRALQQQRAQSLAQTRRSAGQAQTRLTQIALDEERLTNVIAELEEARRRAEAARPGTPRATGVFTTREYGQLDWPVEGTVLHNFGREVKANGTAVLHNGIRIAAPAGTPVTAVAAGTVALAEPMGTYGLTVIIQHPGGDYSTYGSLSRINVRKGAIVNKGQILGTVGASDPDLGAHLYFEIRVATRGPQPQAADPLVWLRSRR
ncbi:MAG TPA: peptidoglycan DD-metalloendopeptidase family protein [Gemmatimonadaceae bacterium]|nr:peptidoglycan DD-metalloendopeptidase family protein [Gemmatimonadaceae bacterium]